MSGTVGVVGCGGFVGGACYYAFNQSNVWKAYGYDISPDKTKDGKEETLTADIVFVCVPTPMRKDGSCYLDIVESVCAEIRELRDNNFIVIKSTVLPGTTEKLNEKYGNVLFSPEFLTERRYIQDFIELRYQILGVPEAKRVPHHLVEIFFKDLYREKILSPEAQPMARSVIVVPSTEAELIKYFRNTYLATRISFCNEMYDLAQKLGVQYWSVASKAGMDPRVGNHYNEIDRNEREFSGVCLPKDLNAMIALGKKLGLQNPLLEAVWEKNLQVASKKAWESEEGRAVVDE